MSPAFSSVAKADIRGRGPRVLIAAGGSGGHIFPAVALARALKGKRDGIVIKFVGSDKGLDRRMLEKEGFDFSLLSANKLPHKVSFGLIDFSLKLGLDFIKSVFIILSYRPSVVVGFGGYVSFPAAVTARIFRVPVLLHEQNVRPGRANRLLFRLADRIAVSFEETESMLPPREAQKSALTGNPIRAEILKDDRGSAVRKFGLDGNKLTILVIGGSQGAHSLNEIIISAFGLFDPGARQSLQVIHLTGVKDYEWAIRQYPLLGIEHRVYSFIDRIEEAYSASDLAVTRSGASAIFELAYFGKPMILVPYRYALKHQADNASVFERKGAAMTVSEEGLTPGKFHKLLSGLLNDRRRLGEMASGARRMSLPGASEKLADEVLGLIC
jgi:UDP-N-acetylglucosamine--N-acetylmuramyl-(pentapeptide) pyrophosphoryl-undecaprenol N-acetylglucosamine transferase